MTEQKYDYLFKILLIGEDHVGKIPFLSRFIDGTFTSYNSALTSSGNLN